MAALRTAGSGSFRSGADPGGDVLRSPILPSASAAAARTSASGLASCVDDRGDRRLRLGPAERGDHPGLTVGRPTSGGRRGGRPGPDRRVGRRSSRRSPAPPRGPARRPSGRGGRRSGAGGPSLSSIAPEGEGDLAADAGSGSAPNRSRSLGRASRSSVSRTAAIAASRTGASASARSPRIVSRIVGVPSQAIDFAGGFPCVGRVPHHLPSQGGALRWTLARYGQGLGPLGRRAFGVGRRPGGAGRRPRRRTAVPASPRTPARTFGSADVEARRPTAFQSPIRRRAWRAEKAR